MVFNEFYFASKITEAAINKVRGRGKVVDPNIQGGKDKKNKRESSVGNIRAVFDEISQELPEYVIGQKEYTRDLCLAFMRPHLSLNQKSYRNMIFVFGPEGSGRKYAIRVIAKMLAIKDVEKESSIYYLDFSQYDADEAVDKLLIPDLYKAFHGKSPIVLFDNYDRACQKAKDQIANLGLNGTLKLNRRFTMKNGAFSETTGSFEIRTTDRISANGKYIVLISSQSSNTLNQSFPREFVNEISDILTTKPLSRSDYLELADAQLDDCNKNLQQKNRLYLSYKDILEPLVDQLDFSHGTYDLMEAIQKKIYEPIIAKALRGLFPEGATIHLRMQDNTVYADSIPLSIIAGFSNQEELDAVGLELGQIVGLQNVKEFVEKLRRHIEYEKENKQNIAELSLHMVFTGNPGTGKTTVARLVAKYLRALGVLSSGHLVEVTRGDLVAQYLGQTAPKTAEKIKSAMGGVLFIDEAYSLVRNKEDFFGIEAIDTLVKAMEDNRGNLVVILAGYSKEMIEFMESNSGLKSRFNYVIEFPDYTPDELLQISTIIAKKNQYTISEDCREKLKRYYASRQRIEKKNAGNGRLVRNTIEKAILNHSMRLAETDNQSEKRDVLTVEDFQITNGSSEEELRALDETLAKIVGLQSVKDYIGKLRKYIEFEQKEGTGEPLSLHMVFTGNPGTGKTTIARIVSQYLKALGVLSKGHLVEATRANLVAGYAGQTAIKTQSMIENALGGVLFVDEAYALVRGSQDSFGLEAVDMLVKGMEDNREDLVVILAGYSKEMGEFMESNSGLKSRFNYVIEFPDYTPEELLQITDVTAAAKKYQIAPTCRDALRNYYKKQQNLHQKDAGNGRLVRNLVEKAILEHTQRWVTGESGESPSAYQLNEQDFHLTPPETGTFDLEELLEPIVGMEPVKQFIRSLYATLRVNQARVALGIASDDSQTLHMIFTGNPGTGKTTMARVAARILYEMGVLETNKLVEVDRSALVAGYVGQTAEKTRAVMEQARGGVLFVDEAYALASGDANDFGRESIDTMVKYMEDHRSEIVVILAGYRQNMQRFLSSNPGLESRFPTVVDFPDYTAEELLAIIQRMYAAKHYVLGDGVAEQLLDFLEQARRKPGFGNGRYARNLCERSIRNHSLRVTADGLFEKEALTTILAEDVLG